VADVLFQAARGTSPAAGTRLRVRSKVKTP
jgi:hypothetical protein